MARTRSILGLIAGLILILSGAAHSILGGKQLQAELAAARVPADLGFSVKLGWQFGGMAMLAFGIIVMAIFTKRLRSQRVDAFPAVVIAVVYLAFGAWALIASRFDPFFCVFLVPAVLVLVAAPDGQP